MTLIIEGHSFHYEMENLCRLFFPYIKIKVTHQQIDDINTVFTGVKSSEDGCIITVSVKLGSFCKKNTDFVDAEHIDNENEKERRMSVLLFNILSEYCGFTPKWGILTGVRPVKLLRMLISKLGEQEGIEFYRNKLLVSKQKTDLSLLTMHNEGKLLSQNKPNSFSLYISIPFCPTRCAYCSFVSSSVEKTAKLIPKYLELLCKEIEYTSIIANNLNLHLESIYIGGGTPTTLSAKQLRILLITINKCFDINKCREFTVEAGRPDTITSEKLLAIKKYGVTRISINPQTLNDDVLKEIGRKHTSQQTISAFDLARSLGFNNINMDLIAGLPKDSLESFVSTIDKIIKMSPENITVHTLSLKRSAKLFQDEIQPFSKNEQIVSQMLDYADEQLLKHGYLPYYLYRQSRMVGNFENTGWCRPGFESPYNIFIMDETQTILACGAGASSKIKDPKSDRLERVFNFKYPYEYISRHEEIIMRKDQVKSIYEKFC
jgi:oxygen-independent coproporphyrinogen-3 oxidase